MSVGDIFNFIQIDEQTATGGQPSEADLRAAGEAGYEVVINLAPDGLDSSLPGERELLQALGIEYHQIPVVWTEPRLDQLEQFEALMDAVGERRTLIHCQANYRVSAFYALYAEAKLGWSAQQGDAHIERIWNSRPEFQMDETWKGFVAAARERPARSA